jgi:hypothetical protein
VEFAYQMEVIEHDHTARSLLWLMIERHSSTPPPELIQPLKDSGATTAADWIADTGNFESLIGYLDLVWRDFVLHDGCLLPEGFNPKNYDAWMQSTNQDRTSVEAVMNHIHILDLFSTQRESPTLAQVLVIGRVLREMWTAKLAREYPHLSIKVSFPDDQTFDDLLDYQITVYQNRPET